MDMIHVVLLVAGLVHSSISEHCHGCELEKVVDPEAQATLTDILKDLVPSGTQNELTTLVKITKYSTKVVAGLLRTYEFQAEGQKTGQMYLCRMQILSRAWQKSNNVREQSCTPLSIREKRGALNLVDVDPNSDGVKFVMWKTLTKYNRESKKEKLTLVRVTRARTQEIPGMRYEIDFEALNQNKTPVKCSSVILRMPWITDESLEIDIKCSPIKA